VADEGGGIPRSSLADVWSYNFVGSSWRIDPQSAVSGDGSRHGLGLPLSRLYAKHFGGALHVTPMEGYGTDCYARFNRLSEANCELPLDALRGHMIDSSPPPVDPSFAGQASELGEGLYDAQARRDIR